MKKELFEIDDYKLLVRQLLRQMPKNGYGQLRKIAAHLGVNSVIISQVFNGDRHLTQEQALDLAAYLGFTDLETQYFLLLVLIARAGHHRLKAHYKRQLESVREKSRDLKSRLPQDKTLDDNAKAQFYSEWYYSAVRLTSSIDGLDSIDAISDYLRLPRATVKRTAEFLLEHGLCRETNGKLGLGPSLTHLEASSPMASRSQTNWRLRALQNLEPARETELFYSAPMVLSHEDCAWVRARIVELISTVLERVKASDCERLACLNIDWFDFRGR